MNNTAIVTGGARGIGKSIVNKLLTMNYKVVIADKNIDEAKESAKNIAHPEYCKAFNVDVSNSKKVSDLFSYTRHHFGLVSVLINNAGIQTEAEVINMSEEVWDETIDVNLKGVFNCSKEAAKDMSKLNWGRIINISSISARRPSIKHAHYCASKAGVLGFTRALALELAEKNITINSICPGIVNTRMPQKRMKWKKDKWLSEIPLNSFGTPDDIANIVSYLVSKKGKWITGQTFHINGGMEMY